MSKYIYMINNECISNKIAFRFLDKAVEYNLGSKKKNISSEAFQKERKQLIHLLEVYSSIILRFQNDGDTRLQQCVLKKVYKNEVN